MVPDMTCHFVLFTTACLASEILVSMGPSLHLWFLTAKQRLLVQHTSLYGFQTSPVVLCKQNSDFRTRITSLCGSKTPPVVFALKTALLGPKLHVSMDPRPHLWICACKTACLASEFLVSMGPSPHLRFLHAKQRLLDPITNIYGSQRSPVVLCMQNVGISTRNTSLYGSQTSSVVFAWKQLD